MANESVNLGDTVRFAVNTHNSSGVLQNADSTPRFYIMKNDSDTVVFESGMVARTNAPGTYRGWFPTNWPNTNLVTNDYIEIHVSGQVNSIYDRAVVKSFVINDVYNANIVQETGVAIDYIFYADIELIQNTGNGTDTYGVQWFRNTIPISSGEITNPAYSVYNSITGAVLFNNRTLDYASPSLGVLSKTETTLTSSGIPYLVVTSGTINSSVRQWQNVVGKL